MGPGGARDAGLDGAVHLAQRQFAPEGLDVLGLIEPARVDVLGVALHRPDADRDAILRTYLAGAACPVRLGLRERLRDGA